MKLCRFLLPGDPQPRTGVFHDGAVYETDGERALGVHQPDQINLLAPIAIAPTIRFFNNEEAERPQFEFGNSAALVGPEVLISPPKEGEAVRFEPMVAAIIGASGDHISPKEAEQFILGYTILTSWIDPTEPPGSPKRRDFAITMGPFLVTPDELADKLQPGRKGPTYDLKVKALVGETVLGSASLADARWTFGEAIAEAGRGGKIVEGEIIALGLPALPSREVTRGDEVTVVVEKLGALMNPIGAGL